MLMRSRVRALPFALAILATASAPASAQTVTSPKQQFGFDIGTDYQLPNYQQLMAYWQKLDRESDRMRVVEIGKTAEGRPQLMAIITSPENQRKLDRYREISRRLALAEGLTDDQARSLAREGKTIVWIDGGLHATEVLGAQQLMETVYQLVSRSDPETLRILNDCVILAVHANPDGHDLVADWYMREKEPTKRSTSGIPRLYQKYIGHDNNRDFYIANQPETTNMNRVMYSEWFPQIVYNHHQTGPAGAVMFAPPFRDPFNYFFDPLVPTELDMVGAAMHTRFAAEGKPGVVTRQDSLYSTWWNGGLRTMVYFHNGIGLLTETIGNPTPIEIPFVPDRQLPNLSQFYPIAPQTWHFRQSIDYSVTANYAVLDLASRNRENFLFNFYRMGKNSIERGSRDSWTVSPTEIDAVKQAAAKETASSPDGGRRSAQGGRGAATVPASYFSMLHDPAARDPRGYIIPSNQPDFPTATRFVNALIKGGIAIQRATAPFTVGGKDYPAGSYVVKTAQSFRPHILDMFEPQDHPNDFQYPGGPPIPPYDNAGWTLAYQMGVQFDRILEGFDGPFEKISGLLEMPPAPFTPTTAGAYRIDHRLNNAVIAVNRLLAAGQQVSWNTGSADGGFFVPASAQSTQILQKAAHDLGIVVAVAEPPAGGMRTLRMPRIGLWDQYGGSMPSGWTRWLMEQYEFPFEVVYPQALDAGNLKAKYDVLIFVDGALPERDGAQQGGFSGAQPNAESIPAEYRDRLGRVTVAKTVPQIEAFLKDGGTVLAIGSSTSLAYHLKLPVSNALVESAGGTFRPLPQDKFYIPGSVLRASVDTTNPLGQGIPPQVDVFFDHSPAFRLDPDAARRGVHAVAWYDSPKPLRSGWAWGQQYLDQTVAIAEATVGNGRLLLFGPEILFRGQPHGTFKFFFNGLYLGGVGAPPASTTEAAK
ncbi:MAG: M14 metallopeptidase family protein [Acidobacteriota bacterium]